MSSNPQELAVELVAAFIAREVGDPDLMGIMRDQARRLVGEITEAGLLVTSQASSAERDKEELVQRIAAELADYRLSIGPNTQSLVASGSWKRMPLSVSERREIAELAATEALRVVRDE